MGSAVRSSSYTLRMTPRMIAGLIYVPKVVFTLCVGTVRLSKLDGHIASYKVI
jgi:hypothetical protein